MSRQMSSGMAFEYAVALSFSQQLTISIAEKEYVRKARNAFNEQTESTQKTMLQAGQKGASFLIEQEGLLKKNISHIQIQPNDSKDVRDVLIVYHDQSAIGVSAKHKHYAVKHSRLSDKIDFGTKWMNVPCSDRYWKNIAPIFKDLREREQKGELWRDLPIKHQQYYLPILLAFKKEIWRIYTENGKIVIPKLLKYLLGEHDFYKVIKETTSVVIQSFNLSGNLKWGKKLPIPNVLLSVEIDETSNDTVTLTFNKGWQLTARLHNAESKIKPSLKFDIQIIGLPAVAGRQQIQLSPSVG